MEKGVRYLPWQYVVRVGTSDGREIMIRKYLLVVSIFRTGVFGFYVHLCGKYLK